MKFIRQFLIDLSQDDQAQATTEYIIMLSLVVVLAIAILRNFLAPQFKKLNETLVKKLNEGLFQKGSMHRIRL